MPHIQYAFREDAKTITMLTQGCTAACPLGQILTIRNREIAPMFLDQYMVLDIKGSNFPISALSEYGRNLSVVANNRRFFAIIDSQIEFRIMPRVMHKLAEFIPAYTGTGLYNYFEGQPYGYLIVLKVFCSSQSVPDELLERGRLGSSQIYSLYDEVGEKTQYPLNIHLEPVIDEGVFENIKYEILHVLRLENALIGVYGNDEDSKRLLKQKRVDYNDSRGLFKREFNEDDDVDRAQLDYEDIFARVISMAPTLEGFINYVRGIKPPQTVEWQAKYSKALLGDVSAKTRITEMYLRNVIRIALYYAEKYNLPIEDCIQDGIIGLETAIEKYDGSESEMFQRYYPMWVRQVIQREMPQYMYTRYIPIHVHERLVTIMDLGKQRGWLLPSDFELVDREFIELVSKELEVPVDRAKQYVDLLMPEISLEELLDIYEVSELEYDTHLVHDGQAETIQYVQTKELHHILELVLSTLTKRESDVIRLRFGFVDGRPRTLEEIGKEFDITRERIRQIESKALRKLRHPSRAKYLRCFC